MLKSGGSSLRVRALVLWSALLLSWALPAAAAVPPDTAGVRSGTRGRQVGSVCDPASIPRPASTRPEAVLQAAGATSAMLAEARERLRGGPGRPSGHGDGDPPTVPAAGRARSHIHPRGGSAIDRRKLVHDPTLLRVERELVLARE